MVLYTNSLDAGAAGTSVTAANSATSGDAFSTVAVGTNGVLQYSAVAMHGAQSMVFTTTATNVAGYVEYNVAVADSYAWKSYLRFSGLPNAITMLGRIRSSAATPATMASPIIRADNTIGIGDASNTDMAAVRGTVAITADTWYRLELRINGITGEVAWALYLGDSLTVVDSGSATGQALGAAQVGKIRFGRVLGSSFIGSIYYDDPSLQDLTTGFIGPPAAANVTTIVPKASFTAKSFPPGGSTEVVISGGGAAISTARAYAPIATVTATALITAVRATSTSASLAPVVRFGKLVTAVRATSTASALAPVVRGSTTTTVPKATSTSLARPPATGAVVSVSTTAVRSTSTAQARPPVVTGGAGVLAVRATSTSAAKAPVVKTAWTVAAVRATSTSISRPPVVTGLARVLALTAKATARAFYPAISAGGAATVSPPRVTATALAPAPKVVVPIAIAMAVATGTVRALSPKLSAGFKALVTVATCSSTAIAPVARVTPTINVPRVTTQINALAPLVYVRATVAVPTATMIAAASAPTQGSLTHVGFYATIGNRKWTASIG